MMTSTSAVATTSMSSSTQWTTGGLCRSGHHLLAGSRLLTAGARLPVTYANNFLYSPYPWSSSCSTGTNRNDAELMQ